MIVFPAVDIQNGKAVRLKQGRKDECTIFDDSPVSAAKRWQELGARWLHIVDLDGAFDGHCANAAVIGEITRQTGLPVQAGGGIRDIESARRYIDSGVARLIIGTLALENQDLFARMCSQFPGRIGVSLDARDGMLKTRGWLASAHLTVEKILPHLQDAGAAFIIYTDIGRDGMQSGVNLEAIARLLAATSLPVIAAGGIDGIADIKALYGISHLGNLEGAISGRALYEGALNLAEATAWLDAQQQNQP